MPPPSPAPLPAGCPTCGHTAEECGAPHYMTNCRDPFPASPVPPLPATYDAPTIARWLLDSDHLSRAALAVSVRALVEAKVREAVSDGLESTIPYNEYDTAEQADARAEAYIDSLVARVLGVA